MQKLKGLDLFSGIGGISLAIQPWAKTVAYCEIDPYCQKVLQHRMDEGSLNRAGIYTDVKELKGFELDVDIITGGFPCQDISVAGRGKGLEGERSGLFFEIVRLLQECRAPFVFLENVPALCTRGGIDVVRTLAEIGYSCRWTTLSAQAVGANHKRERWFLLGYNPTYVREANVADTDSEERTRLSRRKTEKESVVGGGSEYVADTDSAGLQTAQPEQQTTGVEQQSFSPLWWAVEPDVGRVAHGIPSRVDRIKALGNAVVPLQVRVVFEYLLTGKIHKSIRGIKKVRGAK